MKQKLILRLDESRHGVSAEMCSRLNVVSSILTRNNSIKTNQKLILGLDKSRHRVSSKMSSRLNARIMHSDTKLLNHFVRII
ncbi:hypothetical protein CDAR_61491 [Caerostris darwini]|uniref:Uncharacterized protein n=1 Tax=Caerostris darwini TaxID=1538125 RepID=A0AAV4UJH1_9ARAC|nr:hypothetical protein CDAR_61491 [Caerostris darwini]